MPTTTATAAKPLWRKRLTKAVFALMPARRLLFSGLIAIALVFPAAQSAFAQTSAASVAVQIKASAGGKLKGFYRIRGYWPVGS